MPEPVDVYWSFRSPYSYLVTPDLLRLREDFDVLIRFRPVLPIALRASAAVFDANDKKKPRYIVMDSRRRAEFLGLPFVWPKPDPVVQNPETFEVADEQPLIWRLNGLGIAAEGQGKGIDVAHAIAQMLWRGTPDWNTGNHLADACRSVGLDLEQLEASVDADQVKAQVEENQQALDDAGHWGVPTMVFEGEPFFGQDRIDTLRWRLAQSELERASNR